MKLKSLFIDSTRIRVRISTTEANVRKSYTTQRLSFVCILTWLTNHVCEAYISTDCWIQINPQRHGVQFASLVQLIQQNLKRRDQHQGCVLAEPGGPWQLTFALGGTGNIGFFVPNLYTGRPGSQRFKGFDLFFEQSLEHTFLSFTFIS